MNCIIWKLQDFVVKPYTKHIPPAVVWSLKTIPPNAPCPLPSLSLFSHISTNFQSDRALSFFRSQQFCIQPKSFWTKNNNKKLPTQLPFSKLPINVHQHISIQVSQTVSFVLWYHFLQMIHIIWVALCWPRACKRDLPISEPPTFILWTFVMCLYL